MIDSLSIAVHAFVKWLKISQFLLAKFFFLYIEYLKSQHILVLSQHKTSQVMPTSALHENYFKIVAHFAGAVEYIDCISAKGYDSPNECSVAQSAVAVEYTDCISAEGYDYLNQCHWYDSKQPDDEAPVMLELWEMQSTPSLPSLPGPLLPKVVAPDRVITMGQLFDIYAVYFDISNESK